MADFTSLNGYNVRDAQAEALLIDNASKNLLNITAKSRAINGITFTVNNDSTITLNGTSTDLTAIDLTDGYIQFPKGNFILTGTSTANCRIYVNIGSQAFYDNGSGIQFTVTNNLVCRLQIENNTTLNNVVMCPMIRRAEIIDDAFEPYYRTQKQLDADLTTLTQQLQALTVRVEALENG